MKYLVALLAVFLSASAFGLDRSVQVTEPDGSHQDFVPGAAAGRPERTVIVVEPNGTTQEFVPKVVAPQVPVQPTGLKGVGLVNSATLIWNDNATDETSYRIDRDSGSGFEPLASLPANSKTFVDSLLDSAKEYSYRVAAVKDGVGTSSFSETIVVKPLPPPADDPAAGRIKVGPGFNFNNKSGKYYLANGTYPAFNPADGLDLRGESREGVRVVVGAGQAVAGDAEKVFFTDLTIDGQKKGGIKSDLNDKAMVRPRNGWGWNRVTVKDGAGCNIGIDGSGLRFYDCISSGGAASNWGGKPDATAFFRCRGLSGNQIIKSTDGGVWGKFSRANAVLFVDCDADTGTNTGFWGDINNSNWVMIRCKATNITLSNNSKSWTASGFKVEIPGNISEGLDQIIALCREFNLISSQPTTDMVTLDELKTRNFIYKNCTSINTQAYDWDMNEVRGWLLYGCSGTTPAINGKLNTKDGGHVSPRDLTRSDAKAKGREKDWVQYDGLVVDFKVLDNNPFILQGGGTGNKISLSKYKIVIKNPLKADGTSNTIKLDRVTN